jgi:hypothetical protein
MKIQYLKSLLTIDRRRLGVALSFFACLCLTLTSSVAQLKTQRRVTGLQLGAAAEGSRVTVVSDSPLNDYEAFRRGDRFYVKIPLADFMSALPHFRADGFENVQVQKVGDSLLVSFKLQPGATARINQYGNRLDVVFSAPNKISSNNTASAGSASSLIGNSGTPGSARADRGPDAAGPMPPGSSASRERFAAVESATDRGDVNPRYPSSRRSNASGNNRTAGTNSATAVASPIPSPSTTFSPAPYTSYPTLTTATPVSSSATAASSGSGSSNWSNRKAAVIRWISANRLATLLGGLILLSLIFYFATAILRRKKTAEQAKGAKAKVQPKYSPNEKLDELPNAAIAREPRQPIAVQQPSGSPSSAVAPTREHPTVLTRPTIVSPGASPAEHREHSSEEEEREVFEL